MKATIFNVYLWSGNGYSLDLFTVNAESEYEALDKVVTDIVNNGKDCYFMTDSEMAEARANGDVYELGDDEVEGWMYWDATMEGANCPVWIRSENMKIITA